MTYQGRAAAAAGSALCGVTAGVLGGFLVKQWHWGFLVGLVAMAGVFAGLEGLRAARASEPDRDGGPATVSQHTTASGGSYVTVGARDAVTRIASPGTRGPAVLVLGILLLAADVALIIVLLADHAR